MNYVMIFMSCFVIVYLVYFIFIIARKKSLEKLKTSRSMDYFKQLYKINPDKINIKQFANLLGAGNAFIIAVVITAIEIFDSFWIKLVVAMVIMIPVIYLTYHVIGKYYQKKDVKKCTTTKK